MSLEAKPPENTIQFLLNYITTTIRNIPKTIKQTIIATIISFIAANAIHFYLIAWTNNGYNPGENQFLNAILFLRGQENEPKIILFYILASYMFWWLIGMLRTHGITTTAKLMITTPIWAYNSLAAQGIDAFTLLVLGISLSFIIGLLWLTAPTSLMMLLLTCTWLISQDKSQMVLGIRCVYKDLSNIVNRGATKELPDHSGPVVGLLGAAIGFAYMSFFNPYTLILQVFLFLVVASLLVSIYRKRRNLHTSLLVFFLLFSMVSVFAPVALGDDGGVKELGGWDKLWDNTHFRDDFIRRGLPGSWGAAAAAGFGGLAAGSGLGGPGGGSDDNRRGPDDRQPDKDRRPPDNDRGPPDSDRRDSDHKAPERYVPDHKPRPASGNGSPPGDSDRRDSDRDAPDHGDFEPDSDRRIPGSEHGPDDSDRGADSPASDSPRDQPGDGQGKSGDSKDDTGRNAPSDGDFTQGGSDLGTPQDSRGASDVKSDYNSKPKPPSTGQDNVHFEEKEPKNPDWVKDGSAAGSDRGRNMPSEQESVRYSEPGNAKPKPAGELKDTSDSHIDTVSVKGEEKLTDQPPAPSVDVKGEPKAPKSPETDSQVVKGEEKLSNEAPVQGDTRSVEMASEDRADSSLETRPDTGPRSDSDNKIR